MAQLGLKPSDLVVVTGAGAGMGRAIALRLATMRARLALWDIDLDGAIATVELCRDVGADARAYRVDVSDQEQVDSAAAELRRVIGAPFALINDAAIFPRLSIIESDASTWRNVLGVNLIAPALCARALAPMMIERERGAIINVSSGAAFTSAPNQAHYAASKAGVISLTKSMAAEFAPHVRVNCVLPGPRDAATPMGRAARPEDITGLVAFFLGEDAAFITGQAMAADGGQTMRP